MSLNKLTETQIGQDIDLRIGCADLVVKDSAVIRGNVMPDNITTAGYKLENVDGLGNLAWTVDSGPTGDVQFNGTPPVLIGEVVVYNSVDGQAIKESGTLFSDVLSDVADNIVKNEGPVTVHSDVTDAGSGIIISGAERSAIAANTASNAGSVTVHSDVSSAGSGIIISGAERSAIAANTASNAGSVTVHSDVTSAGSGAIITVAERAAIGTSGSGGVYLPTVIYSAGSALITGNVVYSINNNIVHMSGQLTMNEPTSGATFNVTVSLPPAAPNTSGLSFGALISGIDPVPGRPSAVNAITSMNATSLIMGVARSDGSDFSVGASTLNLNYSCQYQIN